MVDESIEIVAPARPDGHLERIEGQVGVQRGGDAPTDNAAAEDIDHARHVTKPRHVLTYVMSAIHKWFGAVAVNLRSTRSAGRALTSAGMVVRFRLPRTTPSRSRSSISLA